MSGPIAIPIIILGILGGAIALAVIIFLFTFLFGMTWKILTNVFRFIGAEISDLLRFIGSVLSAVVFAPLVVLNIVVGRWSASKHFAGAFSSEIRSAGSCVYRFCIGNPARLIGLGSALEGVEQRVPQAVAAAPGRDKPARRVGQFDGYKIVGSLQGGGSGGKLYIAEPDAIKQAGFARNGVTNVDRVVIKVFSLSDGSSLPQIVRESRALDAAKKLGLVLEHELGSERFYYVMRYVPGDSLSTATQHLHAGAPSEGLDKARLGTAVGYAADLLESLDAYHRAGLWHKDVKPDNIIVDKNDGRAHLVDFGLITPLRSAMTLTTHGTEYFRDPELVRQALRGVKVHQIDGSKFDVYAAGAVLFSLIENSFPAHGGLSQVTQRCPDALRWVIRRAMTDYDRRYDSAAEMLDDLRVIQNASDPFALKPVDLPSVGGGRDDAMPEPEAHPLDQMAQAEPIRAEARGTPEPAAQAAAQAAPARVHKPRPRGRPAIRVANWWSGRYETGEASPAGVGRDASTPTSFVKPAIPARPVVPAGARKPAADQIRSARERARQRRKGAQDRIAARRGKKSSYDNSPGAIVVLAGLLGLAVLFSAGIVGGVLLKETRRGSSAPEVVERWIGIDGVQMPDVPEPPGPIEMAHGDRTVSITEHGMTVTDAKGQRTVYTVDSDIPGKWLPELDATLLVVSDLPRPLSDGQSKSIAQGLAILQRQGAELIGDLVTEDNEDSIEDVASFRVARGALTIESDRLTTKARQWLGDADFDGVLLLAPKESDRDEIAMLLVTERFFTRLPWDGASEQLVQILAGNGFTP